MSKNFIKFNLKSEQELSEVLKEKDNIAIISCNICYEEQNSETLQNFFNQVINLIDLRLSKKVISYIKLNFLCNSHINKDKIIKFAKESFNTDVFCVMSCGLGIQFVADIVDKEVIALTDSIQPLYNSTAHVIQHGITLENKEFFCATCGQCYLNYTAAICPIVNCSKSLLNGPCGGAKNGKCEVNKAKDCCWEEIYKKLQNKSYSNDDVLFRNYNVLTYEQLTKNINQNLELRTKEFFGGLKLLDNKELTADLSIENFPQTNILYLFLSQHIGKPSIPIVKEGDYVKTYQMIAQSDGFISSNLHSPVSGKIIGIKDVYHPKFEKLMPAIVIENDFKDEISPQITPYPNWKDLSKQQIIQIITKSGIVGLGGAMFPTHVKISLNKPIDTLIINASECEPYINADNRAIIEHTKEIFEGIEIIRYLIEPKKVIFIIEDNKLDAIKKLTQFKPQSVDIIISKTKYPQGAEKILIKKLFGIDIPYNRIPTDYGFIIQNVSTVFAIYNAVVNGLPLVERIVTISGSKQLNKHYGNYRIKVGTQLRDILEYSFEKEIFTDNYAIKYSGFMMGIEIKDFNTSIIKGCNGILAVEKLIEFNYNNKCIKCGRCVDVCPMELEPLEFVRCQQKNKLYEAEKHNIKNCIECSCCQYVCPCKIPILEIIKQQKKFISK